MCAARTVRSTSALALESTGEGGHAHVLHFRPRDGNPIDPPPRRRTMAAGLGTSSAGGRCNSPTPPKPPERDGPRRTHGWKVCRTATMQTSSLRKNRPHFEAVLG